VITESPKDNQQANLFCLVCHFRLCYNSHKTIKAIFIAFTMEVMMAKEIPAQEEKMAINRREFLNFAWLASLGFLAVNMAGVTFLFAMPRFKEGEFGGTITVGKIADLPPAGSAPLNFPKVKLWLSNTEEGVTALYKVCTHLGCLFTWREQEDKFVCPCHGSQFNLEGDYIQGPAPRSLDRFVVQAVDPNTNEILAESPDGEPLPVPNNPDTLIRVDTGRKITGKPHA
jgi:cytochrome b6-f complex iron-sulfur subunit